MDPATFRAPSTGRLVPIGGGAYAYVPAPLVPDFRLADETIVALAEAERAVGALNGMGRLLPAPYLLIDPALHREAVMSSRIEGTQASVAEVLRREASIERPKDDIQEVVDHVEAMRHGLERMKDLPLCLNLVCEMHGVLMPGVRGENRAPGAFRRVQNHIGPPGTRVDAARYVPPPVDELARCLDNWERALHETTRLPTMVTCALIHYQFEAIHPFLDGNGRLGRLISILYLLAHGVLAYPLLNLSAYFESDRDAYYAGLLAVSTDGAWDAWVRYFLRAVTEGALAAVADCERLLTVRDELHQRLADERARPTTHRMIDPLFVNPYVTARGVVASLTVSQPAAQAAIRQLVEMGILREVTGGLRNRGYLADDVLAAIEGTPRHTTSEAPGDVTQDDLPPAGAAPGSS